MVQIDLPMIVRLVHARKLRAQVQAEKAHVRGTKSCRAFVIHPNPTNTLNKPPKRPSRPSASPPKAPTPTTPPRTPSHLSTLKPRVPLRNQPAFDAAHWHEAWRLAEYRHMDRKRSVRLPRAVCDEIDPGSANRLPANNMIARINYARIATAHIGRYAEALPRSTPAYFVTLIVDRYTVGLREAGEFDPKGLQAWARTVLPGCNFVGMVEAALYTNVGVVRAGMDRAVSWHVHLILWGKSKSWLATRCCAINARYRTLVPGVTAAHYRPLTQLEWVEQTFYMLKAPISDHRIWARKESRQDDETGEITVQTTGRFRQKKRELRPGDLARMAIVMSDQTLDRLAFAAGDDGKALLNAINAEARAPRLATERLEAAREAAKRGIRSSSPSCRSSSPLRARRRR